MRRATLCGVLWFLALGVILFPATASAQTGQKVEVESKLDDGIEKDPDARYPIFVRMTEQMLKKGGDYEAFAKKNTGEKRSVLRKMVLATLKKNADASWKEVEKTVGELATSGKISKPARFWIVNGFACDANYEACLTLAKSEAVSFVYFQRTPVKQHGRARRVLPQQLVARQKGVYEQILKDWKDDSNEAFSSKGLEIPWNVKRVRADVAWNEEKATGKGVVVGLIDSGLMATPALMHALWKNPKEKLNGKDDDGNGYVDDLFGYDFAADSFYALGDGARMTHGSMCGGIIAGRPINKKKLATGIAPPRTADDASRHGPAQGV